MAAPKTDFEDGFYNGFTVPKLAQLFRMDRRTVTEKLRGVRPTGERLGAPVYHVVDVAAYLVDPIIDIEEYLRTAGPADLPAPLQAQYWSAQNGMLKYKEQAKDLWRTEAVLKVFTTAFRSLSQSLRLFADRLDAVHGLTPEQRKIIEREISDTLVNQLKVNLVDDFSVYSGVADKEKLADIVLEPAKEEDDD